MILCFGLVFSFLFVRELHHQMSCLAMIGPEPYEWLPMVFCFMVLVLMPGTSFWIILYQNRHLQTCRWRYDGAREEYCFDLFVSVDLLKGFLQVILNQIVLGPCVIAIVFAWNNLWVGKLAELPKKYSRDALPTLLYGELLWSCCLIFVVVFWWILFHHFNSKTVKISFFGKK